MICLPASWLRTVSPSPSLTHHAGSSTQHNVMRAHYRFWLNLWTMRESDWHPWRMMNSFHFWYYWRTCCRVCSHSWRGKAQTIFVRLLPTCWCLSWLHSSPTIYRPSFLLRSSKGLTPTTCSSPVCWCWVPAAETEGSFRIWVYPVRSGWRKAYQRVDRFKWHYYFFSWF